MYQQEFEQAIEDDLTDLFLRICLCIRETRAPKSHVKALGRILVALPDDSFTETPGATEALLLHIRTEAQTLAAEHIKTCPDCAAEVLAEQSTLSIINPQPTNFDN